MLAAVGAWWLPTVPVALRALLGVAIVALGIAGDLFESMLKRSAGVKDSSALIPGHGGVLDRIDALLFAAPVYYIVLEIRLTQSPNPVPVPCGDCMKRIAILGSTGSIGQSALAVVDAHPDRLQVVGLAAGENAERLAEQIARYQPRIVAMATGAAVDRLRASGGLSRRSLAGTGRDGLVAVASHPDVDIVLCASSGTDGARGGAGGDRSGQDDRARQQGSAGHGRRHRDRRGAPAGRRDPAGRQRAQRDPPVPARPSHRARSGASC